MSALRRYPKQLILSRKTQRVCTYTSVTLLAKKMLWHNRFLTCFLRGNVNTPGCQKGASKALHSRILNPIFLQSEVVIPEIQNDKKYVLRCNGFMAPKCVTRIPVAVFLVCAKIFIKMMQYPALNDVIISEGPFKTDKEVFGWMTRK